MATRRARSARVAAEARLVMVRNTSAEPGGFTTGKSAANISRYVSNIGGDILLRFGRLDDLHHGELRVFGVQAGGPQLFAIGLESLGFEDRIVALAMIVAIEPISE